MKKHIAIVALAGLLLGCGAVKPKVDDSAVNNPIVTAMDLTKIDNDRVPVIINPGRFTKETVTYRLPKVVQGTYSVGDYGRFIDNFTALDYDGNSLPVNKVDTNTWSVSDATKLDKIMYLVNDSFDTETTGGIGGEDIFSPAGTNIEPDNYVLNLHGFIGYFDSLKNNQYALDVTAPSDFVRTSALEDKGSITSEDGTSITSQYFAQRYFDITDNPMMYGKLDVEEFMVGDIKIVLSVYSPNKLHSALSLKQTIFDMMNAQKVYLDDINSTPRYDIYLYLSEGKEGSPKGFGALEHHTSTVVVMPENLPEETLENALTATVAHEFFHIVTPLSVHSEDVHYFDYYQPTFSKHLWMYEGVTEYFAQHFQVYKGLVDSAEFYNVLQGKINFSKRYDDAQSFTIMSENVLKKGYKENYANVYQKGALIGMCIDILMRKESNGNRSLLSLMKELSSKYGKNKPFEDDKLIAEITEMTYPSVGEFLKTHVEGDLPINYEDFFKMVGLKFGETEVETNYIFAGGQNIVFSGSPDKGIFFTEVALQNSFWKSQDIRANDILKKVNGKNLTLQNAQKVIGGMAIWQPGQEVELELEREGQPVIIKTNLTKATVMSQGLIEDENATQEQIDLRNVWLKG
ncbi:peptidase M61 [Winogradskyella sp.]|uniref:M61 family metallopeptidase n=1 Tax=Winogradskyella sp. TaxID=1883156 RepID=UPI0025EAEF5A|nr:peptidase M61 [Winogradskyella sp.]MBT8244492.1 peptidase M61 [Winogradskyella sp.]